MGIKGFSQSPRYSNRQTFIAMCEKIMKYPDIFNKHFITYFLKLGEDKVVNVRISVAKVLKKLFKKQRPITEYKEIIELAEKLKSDKNQEVKNQTANIVIKPYKKIALDGSQDETTPSPTK